MSKQSDDTCIEYDGPERRKHCDMVLNLRERDLVLEQKLNDFIESTNEYRIENKRSVADLSVSMISIREEIKDLKRPYKIIIWIITILTGAFLMEAVKLGADFINSKFH